MTSKEKLYEGKAKVIYAAEQPGHVLLYFKDAATAFDGVKKETIVGKGKLNAAITEYMFKYLDKNGIASHFVKKVDEQTFLVKEVEIVQIEVVIRNYAAGSIVKRLGIKEKSKFEPPMVETFYKSDELHDPLINDAHIAAMKLATPQEVKKMCQISLEVNKLMVDFFNSIGITLVDFKLEFGRRQGDILLADEITPDGCRLWDKESGEVLDKDRFRFDLGDLTSGYQQILERIKQLGDK